MKVSKRNKDERMKSPLWDLNDGGDSYHFGPSPPVVLPKDYTTLVIYYLLSSIKLYESSYPNNWYSLHQNERGSGFKSEKKKKYELMFTKINLLKVITG